MHFKELLESTRKAKLDFTKTDLTQHHELGIKNVTITKEGNGKVAFKYKVSPKTTITGVVSAGALVEEDLSEAKAVINLNKGVTGSLCKEFTKAESKKILNALKKNERADFELMDYIYDMEDVSVRYSENMPITLGTRAFYLYAANGNLRLGTGGSGLTACKHISTDITADMLVKALPNAEVK